MRPPGFGSGSAIPDRRPEWVRVLDGRRTTLRQVLHHVAVHPAQLDASAVGTHDIVVGVFTLILANVTADTARTWKPRDQWLFQKAYEEVADRWTVYKPAWDELRECLDRGRSITGAMKKLRTPRRRYIQALEGFVDQLSVAVGALAQQ